METIEERAYSQYAGDDCPRDCEKCEMRTDCMDVDYVQAFIDGAQSEHDELTRWHDPKKELPEPMKDVLVKCISGAYVVDFYVPELGCFFGESATYMKVVGWREIHE